jgi:hypothetical protein
MWWRIKLTDNASSFFSLNIKSYLSTVFQRYIQTLIGNLLEESSKELYIRSQSCRKVILRDADDLFFQHL